MRCHLGQLGVLSAPEWGASLIHVRSQLIVQTESIVVSVPKKRKVRMGRPQVQSFGCWELVGGWAGGTVAGLAASPDFAHDGTFFAATMAGLYRSRDGGKSWQRVGEGSTGLFLTAVAVSPAFAHDGMVLVVSLAGDVFRSADGGHIWIRGNFGGRRLNISALEISPNFSRDGVTFVGTMADGVFRSGDRGATWEPRNFGLLDLNVLDLAISPAFGRDETIFAATTTGVFRSQNGGRAWREVAFPSEAAPVQCLTISPDFAEDGTLFAGTEADGVLRSTDAGRTWQALGDVLPNACINALALSPNFPRDHTVLVATGSGVYVSHDAGESWSPCVELPGVLCLALAPTFPVGGPALVGLSQVGIYRSAGSLASWQMANKGLAGRVLTGLALSPAFAADRRLFAFGPGEGVIRSADGGVTWTDASTGLPSLQVDDLAVTPALNGEAHLYAALPQGVWMSRRWGETWERVSDLPAQMLTLSPAFPQDATLMVGTKGQGLWVSRDGGQSWEPIDVPWHGQEVLALALSPAFPRDGQLFVAVSQPDGEGVEVWQGGIGEPWEPVIYHQDAARGSVLAVPHTYPRDGRWYATIGDQLYRPLRGAVEGRGGSRRPAFVRHALAHERPTVIDLAMLPGPQLGYLLAATDRGMYVSADGGAEWHPINDGLSARPMVAVASSPDYAQDRSIYALELGGNLWRLSHLMSAEYLDRP